MFMKQAPLPGAIITVVQTQKPTPRTPLLTTIIDVITTKINVDTRPSRPRTTTNQRQLQRRLDPTSMHWPQHTQKDGDILILVANQDTRVRIIIFLNVVKLTSCFSLIPSSPVWLVPYCFAKHLEKYRKESVQLMRPPKPLVTSDFGGLTATGTAQSGSNYITGNNTCNGNVATAKVVPGQLFSTSEAESVIASTTVQTVADNTSEEGSDKLMKFNLFNWKCLHNRMEESSGCCHCCYQVPKSTHAPSITKSLTSLASYPITHTTT